MMDEPTIPHPKKPFVLIFFRGGSDIDPRYGFVTEGPVSQEQWKTILRHVGYLAPYSIFKPKSRLRWATHGQQIPILAAQAIGRESGGGIMGAPRNNTERSNLLKAYDETIALKMTHIFHDDERDFGTPGGKGFTRLALLPSSHPTTFSTHPSEQLRLPSGEGGENLTISFGAYFGNFSFGGETVVLGDQTIHSLLPNNGWQIKFQNKGGYSGKNVISFYSDSWSHISSPPLPASQAILWNTSHITIEPAKQPQKIKVTVTVDGVGSTSGILPRPTETHGVLQLGDPHGVKRPVFYDDLEITRSRAGNKVTTAKFTFEDGRPDKTVKVIHDAIENQHPLFPNDESTNGARYASTTGIAPALFDDVRNTYIVPLLKAKQKKGYPAPVLLTNWRLSDRPGRFAAWEKAGFTNGSTEYYLYNNPPEGIDKISSILARCSRTTRWAWNDGSDWQHAWLGQVHNDKAILTPDEYQALVVMSVLDGNRWLSVFTGMSGGHLASASDTRHNKAVITAEALYKMARAASWFQSTSDGLRNSVPVPEDSMLANNPGVTFRARMNPKTNETWFATASQGQAASDIVINLPSRKGSIINLETGAVHKVDDGKFRLLHQGLVEPFYFKPSSI